MITSNLWPQFSYSFYQNNNESETLSFLYATNKLDFKCLLIFRHHLITNPIEEYGKEYKERRVLVFTEILFVIKAKLPPLYNYCVCLKLCLASANLRFLTNGYFISISLSPLLTNKAAFTRHLQFDLLLCSNMQFVCKGGFSQNFRWLQL